MGAKAFKAHNGEFLAAEEGHLYTLGVLVTNVNSTLKNTTEERKFHSRLTMDISSQ